MGERPIGDEAAVPRVTSSWQLVPEHAQDVQGLVASAFAHLPFAEALFLRVDRRGGEWLQTLCSRVPISDATGKDPTFAAAIALTSTGVAAMGLGDAVLSTFATPFVEGMHEPDRRRRLSDLPGVGTVLPGGPLWSGNAQRRDDPGGRAPPPPRASRPIVTPITVHALLLLYAVDDPAFARMRADATAALAAHGVAVVRRLPLSLGRDEHGITREHFGFADGISQPIPKGDGVLPPTWRGAADELRWHGVPLGEILLGHPNAHRERAPGPVVRLTVDGASKLPTEGAPAGFANLGLDGSYLVVRELRQDVAAFWQSMDAVAARLVKSPEWVAERVVGRTRDGDPLGVDGPLPREQGETGKATEPANAFGFVERGDLHGHGCPLGAHIRRAYPRDSLPSRDGDLSDASALLASANSHRILRRGRKFGLEVADLRVDDECERGLLFMCLNGDIARQFEFVQQTWLLSQAFATLFDETDPLLGPRGSFTIPADPVRLRLMVETYVRFAGGEYFFLPSLPALAFLAGLPA